MYSKRKQGISHEMERQRTNIFYSHINTLLEKSKDSTFMTEITIDKILMAKKYIQQKVHSKEGLFVILASLNLLNAAIKNNDFKETLKYDDIKGHVARILHYFSTLSYNKYGIDFYINATEFCAYIEIYNIQFSFHHIRMNDVIHNFAISDRNRIKEWRGVRLQRIAGELFDLAVSHAIELPDVLKSAHKKHEGKEV
jgi:hypothetical protein